VSSAKDKPRTPLPLNKSPGSLSVPIYSNFAGKPCLSLYNAAANVNIESTGKSLKPLFSNDLLFVALSSFLKI